MMNLTLIIYHLSLDFLHKERSAGLFAILLCDFATLRETKKRLLQEVGFFGCTIKKWIIPRTLLGVIKFWN